MTGGTSGTVGGESLTPFPTTVSRAAPSAPAWRRARLSPSGYPSRSRYSTVWVPIGFQQGFPEQAPPGYYANPAAYAPPAPGRWGNAPRNSITGPRTFSLDASIARTFRLGERVNLDWRIDATNVLNSVVYAGVNTLITSPQFGLPRGVSDMRRLRSSIRLRF